MITIKEASGNDDTLYGGTKSTQEKALNPAIAKILKLLTLLDRNPHSPTYGCFDRFKM